MLHYKSNFSNCQHFGVTLVTFGIMHKLGGVFL